MSYFVLVRGPLGVGKSTVSKGLAKEIDAAYISVDRILDEQDLWYSGRLSEFLRVNKFAAERAGHWLRKGTPVVLDGNFYWKSQIRDLVDRLDHPHFIFTLKAPLSVCIKRDAGREKTHGSQAAGEVYAKSTRFDYGTAVDAVKPIERVVSEIVSHILVSRHTANEGNGSSVNVRPAGRTIT
jgi:predicted kinase